MYSAVIPVFNEEESLQKLHQELDAVCRENSYEFEFVFVDDGSTDGSWSEIEKLAQQDSRVHGIRFRRNFGKAAALSAGFAKTRGDFVFTLDADLQDDPAEMPNFLAKIEEEGVDVVSGWKKKRHDPWHKVFPSRVFNWLVGKLTKVKLHDHNCGFKCYRREIFDEVRLYGELHRFVPVLAAARGWTVSEVVVHHRSRQFGKSKYGVKRFARGFLDLLTVYFLTGYRERPQHLLGGWGMLFFLLGGLGLTVLTALWFVSRAIESIDPLNLHTRAVFYYSIFSTLFGAQLMSIGFIAELITAQDSQQHVAYSIREIVGVAVNDQSPEMARVDQAAVDRYPNDGDSSTESSS